MTVSNVLTMASGYLRQNGGENYRIEKEVPREHDSYQVSPESDINKDGSITLPEYLERLANSNPQAQPIAQREREIAREIDNLLNKAQSEERAAAALNLANYKEEVVIQPLILALSDSNQRVSDAAQISLKQMGDIAVPALISAVIINANPYVRRIAGDILASMAPEQASRAFRAVLINGPTVAERVNAAFALAHYYDDNATVQTLIRALGDQSPAVREEAAQSLGNPGNRAATFALCQRVLGDSSKEVRAAAASSLGSFVAQNNMAIQTLIRALQNDPIADVREAAAFSLVVGGRLALKALEGALQDPDWGVQAAAADRLGLTANHSDQSVIDALEDLAAHGANEIVRGTARLAALSIKAR